MELCIVFAALIRAIDHSTRRSAVINSRKWLAYGMVMNIMDHTRRSGHSLKEFKMGTAVAADEVKSTIAAGGSLVAFEKEWRFDTPD